MDPSGRTWDDQKYYKLFKPVVLTDLLTVGDVVVVIIAVLGAISMKRCPDISFPIIEHSEASLECFEDLNRGKVSGLSSYE